MNKIKKNIQLILYIESSFCILGEKKYVKMIGENKDKVKSTLSDTKLNFFSDSTLAGTILIDLTHADTIYLQIPY